MMPARRSTGASATSSPTPTGIWWAPVHSADIQDREGAPDLLASIRYLFTWLRHVFADGGYADDKLETALAGLGQWTLEIVKRSDQAKGFRVLPRRWVVERTFAWFSRSRRLAKDFETTVTSSQAWLYLASIQLLARRLARPGPQVRDANIIQIQLPRSLIKLYEIPASIRTITGFHFIRY
jgi:transposase